MADGWTPAEKELRDKLLDEIPYVLGQLPGSMLSAQLTLKVLDILEQLGWAKKEGRPTADVVSVLPNGCPACAEPIEYPHDYRDPPRSPQDDDLSYGTRLFSARAHAVTLSMNAHFKQHPEMAGLEMRFE